MTLNTNFNSPDSAYHCQPRIIPLWLVLLDNVPTIFLFVFGFLIIMQMSVTAAIIYAAYSLMSVIWFWGRICPYCPHYETHACPCGYGLISSKLFERKNTTLFKQVFKRNILVVFPNWFVPFGIAVYLLITGFSAKTLTLTIIFSITGFVIIPLISKLAGCKNCEIKDDCPWMTFRKGHNEINSQFTPGNDMK